MQPTLRSDTYRPDIDGLRAVSILAVLAYHGFPSLLPGGFVGVDVFFVISGYLITGLILAELQKDRFSFASFYARRVRRIFPALIVVLAAVYIAGWNVLFPDEFKQLSKHIVGATAFAANFVLLDEFGYFDVVSNVKPLLHLWSLGVEEQFYLFWPLITYVLWRSNWNGIAGTLALLLASFALSIYYSTTYYSATIAFYSPLSRLWELAVGALIAQFQQSESPMLAKVRTHFARPWISNGAGLIGIIMIIAATYFTPLQHFPGWWATLPVFGSALVISAGRRGWINRNLLALSPFVFIGLISYALYLWHWPLISFAWIIYGGPPPALAVCVLLALSFVLAWLTYVLIERPIRFRAAPRQAVAGLVVAIVVIGGAGLWATNAGGVASRGVVAANRQLVADLAIPMNTRLSDGSCRQYFGLDGQSGSYFGFDVESVEVCLASSSRPRILVIGDSHAMAMYSAIQEGIRREPSMLLATHSGNWGDPDCLGGGTFDLWLQGRSPCQNVIRNVLRLLETQPSIEAVVFVACQFNPFFGESSRMNAFQDAILALGKRVVWLEPVPTLPPPASCSIRKLKLAGIELTIPPTGDWCRMQRDVIVKGGAKWTEHIEAMARDRKHVYRYDPLPVFCDDRYCHQTDRQGLLYWLLGHLNVRGSVQLLDDFLPWLRANVLSASASSKD
jgi:peptidoglycan/LPS O-acetylase OafA/YrhL